MKNNHPFSGLPDESGDNKEELRKENELLKLKLQAEMGAHFPEGKDIPPEIENQFLKNIIAFEAEQNQDPAPIYDIIGKPDFEKASNLNDKELEKSFQNLMNLINDHLISLEFLGDYDIRTKYKFLTEEFLNQKTTENKLTGMISCFTYEDFHPNHKLDLETRAMDFLKSWFDQDFDEYSCELDDHLVLPDRKIITKAEVLKKLTCFFNSYTEFKNCNYRILDIDYELKNDEEGMGNVEGIVKYDAVNENGETIAFEGPFKFYLSYQHTWWSIFYFIFPGFQW